MQTYKSDPTIQIHGQTMMGHQLTQFRQATADVSDPQEGGQRGGDSRMEITTQRENCEGNIAIEESKMFAKRMRFSSSEAFQTMTAYPIPVALELSLNLSGQERVYGGDQRDGLSPFEYLHEVTLSRSTASKRGLLSSVHIDWDSIRATESALQYNFGNDNDSSSIDSIDSIRVAKIRQLRRRNKKARGKARTPRTRYC